MSSALFQIPPDVAGRRVISLLNCFDLAKLDSAACSHKSRQALSHIFTCTQSFDLRPPAYYHRHTGNPAVWNWFWKRNISVKGIEIHSQGLSDVNRNVDLVDGPISLFLGYYSPDEERTCKDNLFDFPVAIEKVTDLCLVGTVMDASAAEKVVPSMTNLTSIVDESTNLEERGVLRLIHPGQQLVELKSIAYFTEKLLNAVLPMGLTLRSLSFSTSTLKEEHYKLIAQHCPHLTTFHLEHESEEDEDTGEVPPSGAAAIARGCHQLQDVKVHDNTQSDDTLLQFALHCPHLRRVDFERTALTDASLQALSRHCPLLVDITALWLVQDLETVHNAAAWLARLQKVNFTELGKATMSAALACLRDIEFLTLYDLCDWSAQDINTLAARCSRLREFEWNTSSYTESSTFATNTVACMEHCFAVLMRSNPHLYKVSMTGKAWLTDTVVEAIADSCPRLEELMGSSEHFHRKLTDAGVVKLAKGCPKLRQFVNCSGPGMTNASVLAFAQHCRYLEHVDFINTRAVTEAALMQLVERAWQLQFLFVMHESTPGVVIERLKQAARSRPRPVGGHWGTAPSSRALSVIPASPYEDMAEE